MNLYAVMQDFFFYANVNFNMTACQNCTDSDSRNALTWICSLIADWGSYTPKFTQDGLCMGNR